MPKHVLTEAGPGRPKGLENRVTREVKAIIEEVFDGLGGAPAMLKWAQQKRNLSLFYTHIWTKIIPKNINVTGSIGLEQLLDFGNHPESASAYEQLRNGAPVSQQ